MDLLEHVESESEAVAAAAAELGELSLASPRSHGLLGPCSTGVEFEM